jgi:rod shape-determining protein MreC
LAQLCFYVALSIALFVLDLRFHALEGARHGIFLVTDPLRQLAQTPMRLIGGASDYFHSLETLQAENQALKDAQLDAAPVLSRAPQLEAENAHLRRLLDLQSREATAGQAARILYTARDPFSRRVYLDKGQQQGLEPGQPVIDANGVIGQVTRAFPFSAEVTLLTDKNQTIPVQVLRTGLRSFTFGMGDGTLELKYIPVNTDVQAGDMLITSGLDGIYLPGFPVAEITRVDHDSGDAFAHIIAVPVAAVENNTLVMVLQARRPLPPSPDPESDKATASGGRRARSGS